MTYNVIYADPPWRYQNAPPRPEDAIEAHYPTMSLDELVGMNVPSAKDAVLFLWATPPLLPEALRLVAAWGFEYRTCAVWDKERIGLGYWFMQQHELLLVGRSGNISCPTIKHSSVWRVARGRHSAKPLQVRQWITVNYPASAGFRKVELFAREGGLFQEELKDEWALIGNEADGSHHVDAGRAG